MKKHKDKAKIFGIVALIAFSVGTFLAIFGLSRSVGEISEIAVSKTPDAILASAGVSESKGVALPVAYFDYRADECVNLYEDELREAVLARQFEWTECGYYNKQIEAGLAKYELNDKHLPVMISGELVPNRGVGSSNWFAKDEEKNESYAGMLELSYNANGAVFSFYHDEFYPLDEAEFSKDDFVNKDRHNHLFTMSFAIPFTVLNSGEESFEITADDDTFVFVDDKLVIDMGGIHGATKGKFMINENGEVYSGVGEEDLAYTGITVKETDGELIRIFHADRDSAESIFGLEMKGMNLTVVNSAIAGTKKGGIQIAYDPMDPTYVPPLGESSVFHPDMTKGHIVMATILGSLVVFFVIFIMLSIRLMLKRKQ